MPAIAHIGIGFAAKKVAPMVPVIILIIAAEFIEIVFMALWAAGIEHPPTLESPPFSPYSHSLIMGILWSILVGMVTLFISKNDRISWIIGLLVFSHTILDVIASPKTAFYPTDTGMPVFFDYSNTIGFGLWGNSVVAGIGEIGILITGIGIYLLTKRKIKGERKKNKFKMGLYV